MFNLNQFISDYVTHRKISMFTEDIETNSHKLIEEIEGKSVLVIGGAGTIGSSYIRAILPYQPASLVVVDINENGLADLTRDLRSEPERFVPKDYITYPISYADSVFIKMFRKRKGFDIIANFAAHKHVRSEKDEYSIEALLENNVIRARGLLSLLEEYPPLHYFCVSTDKAANPVNIMGASKKIMEEMIIAYSHKFSVTTARFANVAFSNGSLPLGFLDRIAKYQPISAPSDLTRYFVSPEESGQICMLASVLGKSGEIFFPKLREEEVMTFSDMATALLREMDYDVDICYNENEALEKSKNLHLGCKKYPVYYSASDTTGEKTYEEFFTDDEIVDKERFSSLGVITNVVPRPLTEIDTLFASLKSFFNSEKTTKADIIKLMESFLTNFHHEEKGKYLDQKM